MKMMVFNITVMNEKKFNYGQRNGINYGNPPFLVLRKIVAKYYSRKGKDDKGQRTIP
jgi:hypothetical protein